MNVPSLFNGIDARLSSPSPSQRRHLAILDAARPLGLTRVTGGWGGLQGSIPKKAATSLITAGWARIDHKGRNTRLKITQLGSATENRN